MHKIIKTKDAFTSGQKFGDLVAVKRVSPATDGRQQWLFKCAKCGAEYIKKANVFSGKGINYKRTHESMCKPNLIELGTTIDDYIVLERVKNRKHMQQYKVECTVCHRQKIVYAEQLQNHSGTKHQTCTHAKEVIYTKHFHEAWQNMRNRTNPNVKNDKNKCYAKNNINSDAFKYFIDFYDYAYKSYTRHVSEHGEHNTTLDRIDNLKNYEPGNIKWATRSEQMNNSSVKKKVKVLLPNSTVKIYESVTSAINDLPVSLSGVYNCLKGKWKQTKGYVFKYC